MMRDPAKQSWSTLNPTQQKRAFHRFRNFVPNSAFAEQKASDFVAAGNSAIAKKDGKTGPESGALETLSGVVSVASFVVEQVKAWKEEKEDDEMSQLEESIKALEAAN